MNEIKDHYIEKLLETAKLSEGKFKHAALCLDSRGYIVSIAANAYKTHPEQARFARLAGKPKKINLHAEMSALIKAREDVSTIIVCRINNRGELRYSKPCPICTLAIEQSSIEDVWYSDEGGFKCMHMP